jgi:PAS domain S-box-containing protein
MIENKPCLVAHSAFVQDPRRMGSFPGRAAPAASRPVLDESLHRDAFEQMADLCLWVDPANGHIVGGNKALRQSLAYPLREIIGRPVQHLAEAGSLAQSAAAWQAIASGARLADADIKVRGRDGTVHPMSASAWPLQWRDGQGPGPGPAPGQGQGRGRISLTIWRNVASRKFDEQHLLESKERLQTLAYEITVAEARERARIATDLHDDIGQILAMAHLKLGELGASRTEAERARLHEELRGLLGHATRATRTATFDLRSPLPRQLGLKAAIEALGERIGRACNLCVHVDGEAPAVPPPEPELSIVFRVVRELLLNIQKHAQAQHVHITLRSADDQLMIRVADDGVGFDPPQLPHDFSPEGGFGLLSAEAQMEAMGGRLSIESAPGRGTDAMLALPLPPACA